jgi:Zn-dependent protease
MWSVGIVVCFGWIFSLCLHEFGHAIVAYWGGDESVREKGYLTFNPLKYTDAGLSLVLPLLFLAMGGMALPGGAVYINSHHLKSRWWQSAVSAAGPAANVVVGLLLAALIRLIPGYDATEQYFLGGKVNDLAWLSANARFLASIGLLIYFQVFVTIFNLLPIPGLDGYGIIEPWLPKGIQTEIRAVSKYSLFIILGLFWFVPAFGRMLSLASALVVMFLHVPFDWVVIGSHIFNQPINKIIIVVVLMILAFYLREEAKN